MARILRLIVIVLFLSGLMASDADCQQQAVKPDAATLPEAKTGSPAVASGALEPERSHLLSRIKQAESEGVGVKPYMKAFESIESMVKAGNDASKIGQRIESINRGLDDQLKRSRILKIQKPAPPIAASSPPPSMLESNGPSGSRAGSSSQNELIDKIKNKWFGGQIPASLRNKIPSNIDPSKLGSENDIKRLLDKLNK